MGLFGRGVVGTSRKANGKSKLADDDVTDASNNEVDFEEFCQRVEDNDASIKNVTLGEPGINDPKAVALGQCMEGNTNVSRIVIDFSYLDRFSGSIFCFLDFIEKSAGLRSVELRHADLSNTKVCSTLLVLLPAMSKNINIDNFLMKSAQATFYDILTAFWHTLAYAMNTLLGGNRGSTIQLLQSAVAVSLCQCQSMEDIKFEYLPEKFLVLVLPNLVKVKSLRTLYLAPKHYSAKTFVALKTLAATSNSLETILMQGYRLTATRFQPLADGLKSPSCSVNELSFMDCRFNGGATTALEDLFAAETAISRLVIGPNVRFYRASTIVTILSRKGGCKLTKLDLGDHELPADGTDCLKILKAIADGDEDEIVSNAERLEYLAVHTIKTEAEIEAIKVVALNLPKLKKISITCLLSTKEQRDELLDVMKCNALLEKCMIGCETILLNQHANNVPQRKTIDRTAGLKRKESFRGYLSDDEIDQINAKDAFLQLNAPGHKFEESDDENWEDMDTTTNNNSGDSSDDNKGVSDTEHLDATKGSVESALNRHNLGDQVKQLLQDETE